MQDDTSRRRLLEVGALGTLVGLGGCLRLADSGDTTSDAATTGGEVTTGRSGTEADDDSDGTATESGSESDPATRDISGPAAVDHAFVDPRNRMAQSSASAPATSPVVDWQQEIDGTFN